MNEAEGMKTLEWLSQWIFVAAIPYFLIFIGAELWLLKLPRFAKLPRYKAIDCVVSMTLGSFKLVVMLLAAGYVGAAYAFFYEHRLFTLSPFAWWTWALLFFGDDFCYYWYHRLAHRVRLFWSEHVNHHSSEYLNFGTALRQSTLAPFYSFIYYLPLAFIGFHPLAIAVQYGVSLLYQFWIHTETIGKLGWLEKFLNTPSHHRVHHGSNGIYIDKNYAGILIIWDRMFGTFQEEREDTPVKYGLVHDIKTYNLFKVIFHELAHLMHESWNAKGLKNKLVWIFGPPEWTPDGPNFPPDHPRHAGALAGR